MNKHSFLALILLGIISLGCAKEIPDQVGNDVTLTTTITLPDVPGTKALTAAGVKTFAPGDEVAVVYQWRVVTESQWWTGNYSELAKATLSAEDISNDGKSAKISVSMNQDLPDGKVRIIYPANMLNLNGYEYNAPDDDSNINYAALATQDGTLASLAANLDLAVYDGFREGGELPKKIHLENRLAICEFTVRDEDSNDITSSITRFSVSDGTDTYTVSRTAGPGPIYVAMKPVSNGNLTFSATDASNGYEKAVTGKTLEANKMYPVGVTMAKSFDARTTPLTFEAITAGAQVSFDMYVEEGTVQYKLNDGGWINYTSNTPITLPNVGDKVQFRGKNSTYGDFYPNYSHFTITADCYIYGNIMSLVTDFDTDEFAFAENVTLTVYKTFYWMFANNSTIKSHDSKPLVLPATTLNSNCYDNMFRGCTGLTIAPALPATTMTYGCYFNMFSGCTGLTTAPALPATILAIRCYYGLFSGCTGLTTAPALPVTTLVFSCYESMFSGCTGLTTAPALPATTLDDSCYENMFSGCTGLSTAPALPATTLVDSCYESMFSGCTGLTTAPALPATTLADNCYESMFSGCTGLTTTSALPATELASRCYASMFSGCTGLTTAPALPATSLAGYCYNSMFSGCTGLTTAPALPATTLASNCYAHMFSGCTGLNSITCLAEEHMGDGFSSQYCNSWVEFVASSGTFTKAANSSWNEGYSGIPYGWNVVDYVAPNP